MVYCYNQKLSPWWLYSSLVIAPHRSAFRLFRVVQCIMPLNPFPLHFVVICLCQHTKKLFFSIFVSFLYLQHLHSGSFRHKLKVCIHTFTHSAFTDTFLFQQFILLTLTTSSSVERHLTASETSITEASIPTVTTFTGTATVLPVSTAVFKISES